MKRCILLLSWALAIPVLLASCDASDNYYMIPETADFHGYLGLMLQALLGELSRQKFCPVILQENNDVQLDETILRGVIKGRTPRLKNAFLLLRQNLALQSFTVGLRRNIY